MRVRMKPAEAPHSCWLSRYFLLFHMVQLLGSPLSSCTRAKPFEGREWSGVLGPGGF